MAHSVCLSLFCISGLLYLTASPVYAGTEVLRPRGVPLSKKFFYDPGKDFQCLDGSATIPFLLVNDDYCDCDDGSDEPGTSACPNGLFHCSNIGFVEKIIPSSRVNDGICDCCDGSDEYSGSANCPNNCNELGEQLRIERERYLELLKQGNEIRQRYIEEAKQRLEQTKQELDTLRTQLTSVEEEKNAKAQVKTQAEELEKEALDKHRAEEERLRKLREEEENAARELEEHNWAMDIFRALDTNSDGQLTVEEMKSYQKCDRDNDGIVTDDEAKFYLNAATQLGSDEFIESAWPLIKPLVEQSAAEQTNESEKQTETDPNEKVNETPEYKTEEEFQLNHDEEEADEEEHVTPSPIATPAPEAPAFSLEYDSETAKLVEEARKARDDYTQAEGKFLDLETKIRELEVLLESDYGPSGEYMALRGQCFELTDNEYIYKLCPFDTASQRPKAGGTETNLGRWGKWIGPENNRYERFLMEGGVQCWNGPVRSVVVSVSCGAENLLVRASEPNRCEYAFEFKTPAACVANQSVHEQHPSHTEL